MSVIPQGGVYDIEIFQGGTYSRTFALREADQVTRIPLVGWVGLAQLRDKPGGTKLLDVAVDVSQEADLDEEECGTFTITVPPDDSATLLRDGAYDVALVYDNGIDPPTIKYVVEGVFVLNKRVTVVE